MSGTSKYDVPSAADSERCEKCGCDMRGEMALMDHAGEIWCHPCADNYEQNTAESAYERLCEDFHDGGSTAPWPHVERK